MTVLETEIRNDLASGALSQLFLGHLGWDHPAIAEFSVEAASGHFEVKPIAQKRGLHLFEVDVEEGLPVAGVQALVDREVAKRSLERLIVFRTRSTQVWRWPEARSSGGIRLVPHEYRIASPNEDLVQRLAKLRFTAAEESALTLHDVRARVRLSLNAEQVTKRFYDAFRSRHGDLLSGIEGIVDEQERSWYASLLMNRLMFIYFLQMKGFIGEDRDFLRTCLSKVRELRGEDEFYAFYRDLLIPLFHDGLSSTKHAYSEAAIGNLLRDVPFINGGIFEQHPLEERNEIRIKDEYFERIFGFFDSFTWHLDTSPTGNPNEINPDVIGYVFEQYINLTASGRRENGAYYTKQDVTGYMAGTSLLLRLLRRLIDRTGVNPFVHLRSNADLYIREDLRYGWDQAEGQWKDVPVNVSEVWIAPDHWDDLAVIDSDPEVQLPGESWLDVKERRERVDGLRTRVADGRVASLESLVSENLDLRALLLDCIRHLTVPDDVRSAWEETTATVVLDPTCGSGAFLFAALDVLDDVYSAILETAEAHVRSGATNATEVLATITARRKPEQSIPYFRLKHASLNNLYGLDIMPEAVEIAKLRLFLTLAARLERPEEIEPLPDLDFNIKPGNLLVGFKDLDDARVRIADNLVALNAVEALTPAATELVEQRARFVAQLENLSDEAEIKKLKDQIIAATRQLRDVADGAFMTAEGVAGSLADWRELARPFHWFIEFPHVIERGGFDVVVGNPPYVRRGDVDYPFGGFETDDCPDVFAPCMERAASLCAPHGAFSMVVPISFQFSHDFDAARQAVGALVPQRWASTFSRRPSTLFTGVGVRSTVLIGVRGSSDATFVTDTRRWREEFRPYLFDTLRYARAPQVALDQPWPRLDTDRLAELYTGLADLPGTLGTNVRRHGAELGFKQTALYYLSVFVDEPPAWLPSGERTPQTKVGWLRFESEHERDVAFALLAGRLGVWWWGATGDDFDVTSGLLKSFPISLAAVEPIWGELAAIGVELRVAQLENPIVTLYAQKLMGNYDMLRCREITDRADRLVLSHLGLAEHWPDVRAANARLLRMTGEASGTERAWPFPWSPGSDT